MKLAYIYWFTNYNLSSPSGRYRGKYPLETLLNKGIGHALVYPGYELKNILHFTRIFFFVLLFRKKHSLIVFQKIYTKGIYAAALKTLLFFRKKHTIYDLDDAEYLKFPPETIHYFMKHCNACSLGSESLLDYARRFNPNVFLLTSPVIPHSFIKHKKNRILTIGWIGYYNAHRESLQQLLFPALSKIAFPIHLVLLGVTKEQHRKEITRYFRNNQQLIIDMPENLNWSDEPSIYARIREFDLGISPLLDTEMNRAKSAFKLKQYFSCGVPVLASPVGENRRFLHPAIDGYLCNDSEDFLEMINVFQSMTDEKYQAFSLHALNSVQPFSMEQYCTILETLYPEKQESNIPVQSLAG